MANYHDAKIHDWWFDREFNLYVTILETPDGTLRMVVAEKDKDSKGDK